MSAPNPSFYENDSTPSTGTVIDAGNPVGWGQLSLGSIGTPDDDGKSPIHLWNNKNGAGAVDMKDVKIGVKDTDGGNVGEFIDGTDLNLNKPFFEVRSAGSLGCPDDSQVDWVPVGGDTFRPIGDIPNNARRSIHIRCNVPADATPGSDKLAAKIVVDYSYES